MPDFSGLTGRILTAGGTASIESPVTAQFSATDFSGPYNWSADPYGLSSFPALDAGWVKTTSWHITRTTFSFANSVNTVVSSQNAPAFTVPANGWNAECFLGASGNTAVYNASQNPGVRGPSVAGSTTVSAPSGADYGYYVALEVQTVYVKTLSPGHVATLTLLQNDTVAHLSGAPFLIRTDAVTVSASVPSGVTMTDDGTTITVNVPTGSSYVDLSFAVAGIPADSDQKGPPVVILPDDPVLTPAYYQSLYAGAWTSPYSQPNLPNMVDASLTPVNNFYDTMAVPAGTGTTNFSLRFSFTKPAGTYSYSVYPNSYYEPVGVRFNANDIHSVAAGYHVSNQSTGLTPPFFRRLVLVVGGSTTPPTAASGAFLAMDAHRRPLAAAGSTSIIASCSNDGGHSFMSVAIASAGTDPSLLVDVRNNTYRLIYYDTALKSAFGALDDAFTAASGSPAAVGLSGKYPIAAQHPTDRDYALLAYLDGTNLKVASSVDAGASWTYLSTVAAGQNFTSTGRAGLCWLGERVFLVYGSGSSLLCVSSLDRGATWSSAVSIGASGPYSGLSLLGWQGRLYLLAWRMVSSVMTPALYLSPDLGLNWTVSGGVLPALTPPTGLGVFPQSSQLRLGTTSKSDNDGLTWVAD